MQCEKMKRMNKKMVEETRLEMPLRRFFSEVTILVALFLFLSIEFLSVPVATAFNEVCTLLWYLSNYRLHKVF